MAKRDNHYDVAFEAYLRSAGVPYVAVNETRRSPGGSAATANATLKSVDFIVSPRETATSFLVDVKGRHFPSGRRRQFWRNWTTADELHSLARWESLFGTQFSGLLVFAYLVLEDIAPLPAEQLFEFRNGLYGFVGIRVHHYLSLGKVISPKWNTLALSGGQFRELARPVQDFFLPSHSADSAA